MERSGKQRAQRVQRAPQRVAAPEVSSEGGAFESPQATGVPGAVLSLQRSVGNQATAQALQTPVSAPGPVSGPPIQRLMTAAQWYDKTDRFYARYGAVSTSVQTLLTQYQAIAPNQGELAKLNAGKIAQAVTYLEHLKENLGIWLEDHADDTDRIAGVRRPAYTELKGQVDAELAAARATPKGQTVAADIGEKTANSVRDKYRAPTADSALEKLAALVDVCAPVPGAQGEMSVEVEIPVGPVGFIGFRFTGSAEREWKNLRNHDEGQEVKSRLEVAITGGASVPGLAKMKAEFGGFLESAAATSAETMRLFSYGLYRMMRESSVVPREVASLMWGGTSATRGYTRAEKWAAQVEKQSLAKNKGAYVEVGAFGSLAAEVGVSGIAAIKAKAKGSGGSKYSAETIRRLHLLSAPINSLSPEDKLERQGLIAQGAHQKSRSRQALGEGTTQPAVRGAQSARGEHTAHFGLSGEVSAGPVNGAIEIGFDWESLGRDARTATRFTGVELKVSGGIELPYDKTLGTKAVNGLVGLIPAFNNYFRATVQQAETKKDAKIPPQVMLGLDMSGAFANLATLPADQFAPELKIEDPSDALSLTNKRAYKLNLKLKKEPDQPANWLVSLSFETEKGLDTGKAIPVNIKAAIKRSKRLIGFQYNGTSWETVM